MVNFGPMESVPERFRGRRLYRHNPAVTLMRTTPEENAQLGALIARKLNAAQGPVAIAVPHGGVSMIDAPDQPFFDPAADEALFSALVQKLDPRVELLESASHINEPAFAEMVATTFHRMYTAWMETIGVTRTSP
jgi:uncharacterized protein (UPF0261 family)